MTYKTSLFTTALVALFAAGPTFAQQSGTAAAEAEETAAKASPARADLIRESWIQRIRPQDQRGLHVFEPPKEEEVPFEGFKLELGAAFAQQFQALDHRNDADRGHRRRHQRQRADRLGAGFNLASANLNLNAQLAPGIRVALTTYLSSRHHPEAWVKDGYLLIDESPIDDPAAQARSWSTHDPRRVTSRSTTVMRTSAAATTATRCTTHSSATTSWTASRPRSAARSTSGERRGIAMAAVTGGEINGPSSAPTSAAPRSSGSSAIDRQVNPDLRVRLTGSAYTTNKSVNNTLYGGDRAGSRYHLVLENTQANVANQFTSGRINPGLRNNVTAFMVNPFVKFGGAEFFGTYERATGASAGEPEDRTWNQYAADLVYRFLPDEQLYVGGRYNLVNGELQGSGAEVSVDRVQIGAGWFVTPMVLLKAEYVTQNYRDFPLDDIRHGGKFNGFVVEGVVTF